MWKKVTNHVSRQSHLGPIRKAIIQFQTQTILHQQQQQQDDQTH